MMVRRSAGRCRINAIETEGRAVQRIPQHIDRANRIGPSSIQSSSIPANSVVWLAIRPLERNLQHVPRRFQQESYSDHVCNTAGTSAKFFPVWRRLWRHGHCHPVLFEYQELLPAYLAMNLQQRERLGPDFEGDVKS